MSLEYKPSLNTSPPRSLEYQPSSEPLHIFAKIGCLGLGFESLGCRVPRARARDLFALALLAVPGSGFGVESLGCRV